MYNESYEDYIRSILGYPNPMNRPYERNCNCSMQGIEPYEQSERMNQNPELESCYPEIYKIVYPMVNKACSNMTRPMNQETINQMTEEIYSAIEVEGEINLSINLTNEVKTTSVVRKEMDREAKPENRGEDRSPRPRNRGLQDLIRILIIRELLGRPGHFPGGRPPRPPHRPPMRPPFPGGPGMGRPPIMPRGMIEDYDLYE